METRKRFEQVFIKSEADLPKRDIFGSNVLIIFHEKYTNITKAEEGYSSTWDDYFLKNIDWYLLPLEPAEVSEENEFNSPVINKIVSEIKPIRSNFEYCAEHNVINGTLYVDIKNAMIKYRKLSLPQVSQKTDEENKQLLLDFNRFMCSNQYDGIIPLIETCIDEFLKPRVKK